MPRNPSKKPTAKKPEKMAGKITEREMNADLRLMQEIMYRLRLKMSGKALPKTPVDPQVEKWNKTIEANRRKAARRAAYQRSKLSAA